MNWAAIIWLGLMVLFLVIEAVCPLHLISVWFAIAAVAAMIVALLGGAIWLQGIAFLLVSCVLLALLWPLVKKYLNPKVTATNVDSILGQTVLVTQDIDNINAQGQAKVNGLPWTARSAGGERIPGGTLVRIERIEGVKLIVSPVDQEKN